MRNDFLFRGKRKDNGEWVQGYYAILSNGSQTGHCILSGHAEFEPEAENEYSTHPEGFDVLPETVGRCTGLTDKNGVLVFEGDVLHEKYHSKNDCVIEWNEYAFKLKRLHSTYYKFAGDYESICPTADYLKYRKIIGNIHDTPELLENIT